MDVKKEQVKIEKKLLNTTNLLDNIHDSKDQIGDYAFS